MIIEKYDFRDFFNKKYDTRIPIDVREYGLGAVSIITPIQAITQTNKPNVGSIIPGTGHHSTKLQEIAKKILGIEENVFRGSFSKELSFQENLMKHVHEYLEGDYIAIEKAKNELIHNFLDSVVKIEYTTCINGDDFVLIKPPTKDNTLDNDKKISEGMFNGICEILSELKNIGLSSDLIKTKGLGSKKDYEQIIRYFQGLIDSDFTFPFEENIIVEQQSTLEKG